MKEQYPPVIIFTTYQLLETESHNARTFEALKSYFETNNISFKKVINMHLGVEEPSLVVSAEHEEFVSEVCNVNNQELYVVLDQDRNATLVNPKNGIRREVGTFRGVDPRTQGDKVFDPTTSIHYAII